MKGKKSKWSWWAFVGRRWSSGLAKKRGEKERRNKRRRGSSSGPHNSRGLTQKVTSNPTSVKKEMTMD